MTDQTEAQRAQEAFLSSTEVARALQGAARKVAPDRIDLHADLMQEGRAAIVQSWDKAQTSRSLAITIAKRAMFDCVGGLSHVMRVPRSTLAGVRFQVECPSEPVGPVFHSLTRAQSWADGEHYCPTPGTHRIVSVGSAADTTVLAATKAGSVESIDPPDQSWDEEGERSHERDSHPIWEQDDYSELYEALADLGQSHPDLLSLIRSQYGLDQSGEKRTVDKVAAELGMSKRTTERRLAESVAYLRKYLADS